MGLKRVMVISFFLFGFGIIKCCRLREILEKGREGERRVGWSIDIFYER